MNRRAILDAVEASSLKSGIPNFKPGDQVRVHVRIVDEAGERIQPFEGTTIRRRGHGLSETFTVRKVSFGIGVERTFPLHSPRLERIELVRPGRVRRARLYYMRSKVGKEGRIEEERLAPGPQEGRPAPPEAPTPLPAPAASGNR